MSSKNWVMGWYTNSDWDGDWFCGVTGRTFESVKSECDRSNREHSRYKHAPINLNYNGVIDKNHVVYVVNNYVFRNIIDEDYDSEEEEEDDDEDYDSDDDSYSEYEDGEVVE